MLRDKWKILLLIPALLLPSYAAASDVHPATVSTFAGQGVWGDANGVKEEATFRLPTYAEVGPDGSIYVGDTKNHLIRKIEPNGRVTTLTGKSSGKDDYGLPLGGKQNGSFSQAMFNEPRGVAVDSEGNVYIADSENGAIRKLSADGAATVLVDGLRFPSDVVIAPDGTLYVSETLEHRIVNISPDGATTVAAGGGYARKDGWLVGGLRDGVGTDAQFNEPTGLALAEDGTLYIADTGNQRIRAISPEGKVTTVAGSGSEKIAETGYIVGDFQDGMATEARFNYPSGLALAEDGAIYVADTLNHRVRKIAPDGNVYTVAGSDSHGHVNGIEAKASFDHPTDVLVMPNSNLLIVDQWNHALREVAWYELPANIARDGQINVVWNDRVIDLDTPAEHRADRVMVPIRPLAEAFGFEVEWVQESQTVIFTLDDQEIRLQVGNKQITGHKELLIDVAPYINEDRTYVPVRFVAEAFDKHVNWLATSRTVLVRE